MNGPGRYADTGRNNGRFQTKAPHGSARCGAG
jgi:hypothetical protein